MTIFQRIYSIVSHIPQGKVMTYKQIASLAAISNPRIVGFALHANKNPHLIPCHRVVNAQGFVAKGYAFGGEQKQRETLKKEGVIFKSNFQVDLKLCLQMDTIRFC